MSSKSVLVIHRMAPKNGRFADAKKVSDEWMQFLKGHANCKSIDVIGCTESQCVWIEEWTTKAAVDELNNQHLAYSEFLPRMVDCSKSVPQRLVYQQLL